MSKLNDVDMIILEHLVQFSQPHQYVNYLYVRKSLKKSKPKSRLANVSLQNQISSYPCSIVNILITVHI